MPKNDPKTILNLGTDPGLNIYAASTQSIAQLAGNTNVFITNVNQSVVEYINTTIEASAAGNSTEVQFNVNDTVMGDAGLTYNFQTDSLTVTGNVAAGNIRTDHLLYANGVSWNFPGTVTTLPGANVTGQVGNALVAGTVYTNAQPNITSVGTLGNLTVSGNTNLNNVIVSGSLISSGASPAPILSGFILSTVSANLGSPSHVTITGGMAGQVLMTDGSGNLSWTDMPSPSTPSLHSLTDVNVSGMTSGQVLTWDSGNSRWENKDVTGGGSSFDSSAQLHLTNTSFSSLTTNGALVVDGGVGIAGNINAGGTKHTLNGNLHITGVDSSSLYIGAYADVQPMTAPVIVAKDSYDTYVQAALINSSQFGSADWVAYSDQGNESEGWADFGMTGSNFNDINYSITGKNDGYFFVQGLDGQGGNMVLATGNTGGEVHRDIVFATGGFYTDNERMRLNHEDQTLYVGAHGEAGGTNITNLDVNGNLYVRSSTYLGPVANVSIGGGTSGKVLSTDGMGGLSWISPQSGPTGDTGQGFNFRGAYNSGTFYQPYDVVTDGGFAYVSVQASHPGSGDNIFDTDFWQMFAARGAQGIQGEQGDTGAQGVSVTLQGTLEFIADLDEVVNPQQGDAWIVSESNGGDLYFYTASSTWDNIGKIVGPEGPRGPQGLPGETGAQGEPGTPADTGNFTFDGDVLTSPTNGLIKIANTDDGAGIHSLNNRGRMWFDSTNNFYIVVDDTYQHSFSANGKVTFGGGYTFPNVAGTNGQILVTNASGRLSWQDQAGLTNIFDQSLNSYDNVAFNLVSSPSYDFPNAGGISQQGGDPDRYNIFINAESNVVIDTNEGEYEWVLGNDGSLTFPNGAKLNNGTANQFATDNTVTTSLDLRDTFGRGFYTSGDGYTLRSNGDNNWIFKTDGKMTTPDVWYIGNPTRKTSISNDGYANPNDLLVQASDAVFIVSDLNTYPEYDSQWMFSGKTIQLPAGGDIVDSNGDSVLGGGASTGNITFSGDTIGSTNNGVNITGSVYTQLECTDNSSYTVQIWTEEAGAYVYKNGAQWGFTTPSVDGATTNSFEMPNGVKQRSGDFVTCNSNADTVIYTSLDQYNHTLKLLLCIEGVEDGQSQLDTQSCEMIIAKSHRNNTVSGSAYGLVYTSANPLVTLSTRWNAAIDRIEVLCRPVSTMNSVSVHVSCTELSTSQI